METAREKHSRRNYGVQYGDNKMNVCDSCKNIKGTSACKHCDTSDVVNHDAVEHPNHYTSGGIECIEAIRAALSTEEFRGYCKGNMLKYTWREKHKNGDEDIRKAGTYGKFLLGE